MSDIWFHFGGGMMSEIPSSHESCVLEQITLSIKEMKCSNWGCNKHMEH